MVLMRQPARLQAIPMTDSLMLFPDLWWVPLLSLCLDFYLKDPPTFPHPVRAIGHLLCWLEPLARSFAGADRPARLRWAGGICVLFVAGGSALVVMAGAALPSVFGLAVLVYCSYAGLALGGLVHEGQQCLAVIRTNDVEVARRAVAMLVSRDLSTADMPAVRLSLAESVSENFNDAFVAPFFWLLCTGPAGLWAYKAVSTMDSCWGYKNERYGDLGRACARLDDALAYVPARLSALFLWMCVNPIHRKQHWPGLKRVALEARTVASPNAGWPMTTAAWLLGGEMGGTFMYHGLPVHKPRRGPAGYEWTDEKLASLLALVRRAGIAGGVGMWGGCFLLM